MGKKNKIKVGINGFGRIGRAIFRKNLISDIFDVVVINDLNKDHESIAYTLKYDSLHGMLKDKVGFSSTGLNFNGKEIRLFHESSIENVPWHKFGVDIVIGCTGSLKNVENSVQCLKGSVKKVVFSDSPEKVDLTMVMGVNEQNYDHNKHNIIAGSICDVVGSAPVVELIDKQFRIKNGYFLTLHPWLFYQNLLDGVPSSPAYRDHPGTYLAMGRASMNTLIPKKTSIVPALERVLPKIKGKTQGMSFRVPTDLVSSAYMTFELEKDIDCEEIRTFLKNAVRSPFLGYTEEPLVSTDYKHHEFSSIVDGKWIEVLDNRTLRLIAWYDNEWGYSTNILNIIDYISKKL